MTRAGARAAFEQIEAMGFRILGLDHVVVRVRDLDAALRFYRGVLGCTEERRIDALGLVQLRAGASLIDLVPVDSPLGRAGGGTPGTDGKNVDHFCLRIEPFDAEALAAHLRSHRVEPGEIARRYGADGHGPSMYVRDPDGNVVELKGPPES
jgi:catechol 2,3-dioxygenase-like lactoylglutathione lyase family enzyme